METTCNVHGVRTDFLDPSVIAKENDTSPSQTPAPVYFIGKLIWAKGFEQVLEIQELYKSKTGEYFPMDVYGSGNDEKAIQRAFFGRHNPISRGSSTLSTETSDSGGGGGGCDAGSSSRPTSPVPASTELAVSNTDVDGDENIIIGKKYKARPQTATTIFDSTVSLRSEIDDLLSLRSPQSSLLTTTAVPNPTLTAKTIPGAATADTITSKSVPIEQSNTLPLISERDDSVSASNTNVDYQTNDGTVDPLAILSDVTQKTVGTGVETADATVKMVESLIQKGWGLFSSGSDKLRMAASTLKKTEQDPENKSERESAEQKQQSVTSTPAFIVDQHNISIPFHLAPARARFKWRRHPIPARFLGVQDHIVVRDIPQTKIFLNMSTSEVLCTTSAEALAMGKFVILPKHRKCKYFTFYGLNRRPD
jgi:Arc/MetJ-type ribon-helix-helix transcriptional regulator